MILEKTKFNLKDPDENPEHAMDYWKLEKSMGKNVPNEKSRDFCLVFVNSKKKSTFYDCEFHLWSKFQNQDWTRWTWNEQ